MGAWFGRSGYNFDTLCVYDGGKEEIISCQLHGFVDASLKAYSVVIYMVYETPRGTITRLCAPKQEWLH